MLNLGFFSILTASVCSCAYNSTCSACYLKISNHLWPLIMWFDLESCCFVPRPLSVCRLQYKICAEFHTASNERAKAWDEATIDPLEMWCFRECGCRPTPPRLSCESHISYWSGRINYASNVLPHITLCDVTIYDTYHMALSHIVFVTIYR